MPGRRASWRRVLPAGVLAGACALGLVACSSTQPGTAAGPSLSPTNARVAASLVKKWRGQVVKAPAHSTVRLAYTVKAAKAASMTVQTRRKAKWRKHQRVVVRGGERVTVRLPVGSAPTKWRLRVVSARGAALRTSTTVKVIPRRGRTWASGAAGEGVADGSFGRWRKRKAAIAGTWNEDYDAQEAFWTMRPGAEFGSWTGDLDVAVGSIYQDRGETWAKAAEGAYDKRWTASLEELKSLWVGRPGTLYVRFAHEFNGDWFTWQVNKSEVREFKRAWKRYRALQKSIMPSAKLVFCPNDGTLAGYDWRTAFPGAKYVDVMSVDSFNQYPFVSTKAEFESKIMLTDNFGAPLGIERHRQYAEARGLPFAVSEWSSNASMGDSAVYVNEFHAWVAKHAGKGAGRIRYEILFNVRDSDKGVFQMYSSTQMPKAAAEYRRLF